MRSRALRDYPHQLRDWSTFVSKGTVHEIRMFSITHCCYRLKDTIYVVLYTPPLGMNTVRYAGGRDILVLVGKKTITYNDLLGQSYEVPILNRRQAAE
jgi:hypothetical protein